MDTRTFAAFGPTPARSRTRSATATRVRRAGPCGATRP